MSQSKVISVQGGAGGGGVAARRAVIRWAWRLFRREWRQQALVLALLTLAVAAAIFSASAAYNVAPVPGNADFGSANFFLRFDASDPQALQSDIAFAKERFGTVDVITHRYIPVPGSVEVVEIRAQDPQGAFSEPMLALLAGRYPANAGEVAVTDRLAATFTLDLGQSLVLDGTEWTVVGLVENPSNLSDEFALAAPSHLDRPDEVLILVNGNEDDVIRFRAPSGATTARGGRPDNEDVIAAVGVLATATVALLLVGLVAAASFVVVAQRRLRQLGMLAAIGATERHLRLVTVTNGLVIGVFAAVLGVTGGLLVWAVAAPLMEPAVAHRIDPLNVPWWLIVAGMLLAIVTAVGAAWWPARAVARIPVVLALSGRPPQPKPIRRSASMAGLSIAAGLLCLFLSGRNNNLLIVIGTVATVAGILLISPLALRVLGAAASPLPVAVRLALRDLARYEDRSGAALAAISFALGIAAATIITASAAEHSDFEGNLSDRQILIRTGTGVGADGENIGGPFVPERTPAETESLEAGAGQIAALLNDATVIAVDVALDPTMEPDPSFGFSGRPAITLARSTNLGGKSGYTDVTLLYVATPELLAQYGVDLEAFDPGTEVLTVESGELRFTGASRERGAQPEVVTNLERIGPGYSSLPGSFITPDALRRRGWEPVRIGWLVEAGQPLTVEQLAAARELAASAGLTIESRDFQEGLSSLRTGATASGMFLALGVLAMTVGLVRSAAAGDLRTLTATGATSGVRRTLTAATAGALALLGALLGTAGAYLALIAWYSNDLAALFHVPVLNLLLIVAGIPLVAAIAGWLTAGREPVMLARQPIE